MGDCDGGGVSVFTPLDLGLIMPSILSISSCDIVQRVVERKKQKIKNKKMEEIRDSNDITLIKTQTKELNIHNMRIVSVEGV